jgi:hypothetical protein
VRLRDEEQGVAGISKVLRTTGEELHGDEVVAADHAGDGGAAHARTACVRQHLHAACALALC